MGSCTVVSTKLYGDFGHVVVVSFKNGLVEAVPLDLVEADGDLIELKASDVRGHLFTNSTNKKRISGGVVDIG